MVTLMVGTFIFGYILIAIEHKIQINKAAVAVTLGMLLWVMYIYAGNSLIMGVNSDAFKQFLSVNPEYASLPIGKQCIKFISESQIIHPQIHLFLMIRTNTFQFLYGRYSSICSIKYVMLTFHSCA